MPFLCFSKAAKELKSTFSCKEAACKCLRFSSSFDSGTKMLLKYFLILEVSSWTLGISPFNSLDIVANRTLSSSSRRQKVQTWPSSFSEGLSLLASCVRVVAEKDDDEGEDEGEDYGGEDGGLSPFPFEGLSSSPPFPSEEPSPFEGLELSPCNLEFLSS